MERIQQEHHKPNGHRDRLWSPMFILILLCTLCAFLVGQGSNAGTTVYLDRVGGSAGLAGLGALCFSIAAAVGRLVSGPAIDERGRRLVMVAGAAVMVCGTIGPLFANEGIAFIVWRVLQGAGFSALTTATATAAADVTPLSRLGEGVGYYGLGQAVSMSIGPALALFLASTDPATNLYIGLTCSAVAALALAIMCRYEKHPEKLSATSEYRMRWEEHQKKEGQSKENARLNDTETMAREETSSPSMSSDAKSKSLSPVRRLIHSIFEPGALRGAIPITIMSAMFSFSIFYMGLFGARLGLDSAGLFYVVSAVVMIAIRLTSGRFMDSVAPIRIMGIAVLSGLVAFTISLGCALGIFGNITGIMFVLAGAPYGLSIGLAIPVNQTVAVRCSPADRWGAANALFMLGVDIGNAVAASVWGALIEIIGFPVVICCVLGCCAASYVAARACYPKA